VGRPKRPLCPNQIPPGAVQNREKFFNKRNEAESFPAPLLALLSSVDIRFPFFAGMWGKMIWAAQQHRSTRFDWHGKAAALPKFNSSRDSHRRKNQA
jgi:hypothetical protein